MKKVDKTVVRIFFLILFFLFPLFSLPVEANEGTVGYSVKAILPENQKDANKTYFDLLMEPNQTQELYVEIFNTTSEEARIDVAVTNATSNRNGIIDYTNTDAEIDESLETPLTEIASVEEETVTVPATSSTIITVNLEMPPEEFDGIILGGLYFEKQPEETEEAAEGVSITNRYSYVLGVQLSQNDKIISPELHMKSIEPGLVNGRTSIVARIQNNEPIIVRDLDISTIVYDEDGNEVRNVETEGYSMAPNSTMEYVIDWENQKFDAGVYTARLQATNGQKDWEWEESFEIEGQVAATINEEAVEIDDSDTTWVIIAGVMLVLFITILALILYIRNLKSKLTT